jgi:hypothetical protein
MELSRGSEAHRGLRRVDVDVCECRGRAAQGVHFSVVDGAVQVGVQPSTGGEAANTVISCQKSTESNCNTDLYMLVNNFDVSELAVS